MSNTKQLLESQICFLLYANSREMTKKYKPLLEKLGITYPQYLVLLLLWEQDELTVKQLGDSLHLDSGTLTPMLKRMERHGLIVRMRSELDERLVHVHLTAKGQQLKEKASQIPDRLLDDSGLTDEEAAQLRSMLKGLLTMLRK